MRLVAMLLVAVALLVPAAALAEIKVDGEVRVRSELDAKSVDPAIATGQVTDLRTRLGLSTRVQENTLVFLQFQDSRRLGGRNLQGSPASGTLAGGSNVDVHQAYIRVDRLGIDDLSLQAGRFEVNHGNQRVFGGVGWSQTGRSWEGGRLRYEGDEVHLNGYWLKGLERNSSSDNRDFDLFGLYTQVPGPGVDLFVFFEHDAEETNTGEKLLQRVDLGTYVHRKEGSVDYTVNGVLQLGDKEGDTIQAFLVTAEVGKRLGGRNNARVALGVDYASGDSDPADGDRKAYDNLYYTGHKFRGTMDYFLASATTGLLDVMAGGSYDPAPGWTVRGDAHYFASAVEFTDFQGNTTRGLGVEVDLGVTTTRVAGVTLDGGVSLFFPAEAFAARTDGDTGLWVWTMMTSRFGTRVK